MIMLPMDISEVEILAVRCVVWLNDTLYSKVSKVNRKCHPRNVMVRLSNPYTDPE